MRHALCLLLLLAATVPARAQTGPPPPPCQGEEHRQFDFWIGEWELSWANGGKGHNTIAPLYGDCGVEERFESFQPNAWRGMSVSQYDARSGKWRQTWADSQGGFLSFEGGMEDGGMVLHGKGQQPDGTPVATRMRFVDITANSLRWLWERSTDGGESYALAWEIQYTRVVD